MTNLLPDNKLVALPKLKASADNNVIVLQLVKFLFDRVKNMMPKGEITSNQYFLHFFQKVFLPQGVKNNHCMMQG